MPVELVKELRNFITVGIQHKVREPKVVLNALDSPEVPDEVMDAADKIEQVAKKLFGKKLEPNNQQKMVLQACGFPITPGEADAVGWKVGHIQTPVGIIAYQ